MADQYAGLNPVLASKLNQLNAVCPHTVSSGRRSNAQQAELYRRWKAGELDVPAVAEPGTSNHETGDAADISGDYACFRLHAPSIGLEFPVPGEPWHAEVAGGASTASTATPAAPEDPVSHAEALFMNTLSGVVGDPVQQPTGDPTQPTVTGATTPGQQSAGQGAVGDAAIAQAAYAAGFRGDALVTAVAVALAESGGNPAANATGTEDSRGLWQINVDPSQEWGRQRAATYGDLYDPSINARAAFDISGGGSTWEPWTVYKTGAYQQYVGRAQTAVQGVA